MSDEGTSISQPELKQAAKTHRLTVWQRQWDISGKGRFLYQLNLKLLQSPSLTSRTEYCIVKLHNLE